MNIKLFFLLVIAVSMLSCSGNPPETKQQGNAEKAASSHTTDQEGVISIAPSNATVRSVIKLSVSNKSIKRSNLQWLVNQAPSKEARTTIFSSDNLKKGDVIQAIITDNGIEYQSNQITIHNSPPFIKRSSLSPKIPVLSSRLIVDVASYDDDGDYIAYKYKWERNGDFAGDDSYLENVFKRGDTISVEVTPLDRDDPGKSTTLTTRIYNSQPEVLNGTYEFNGKQYKYQITSTDPDGDALVFKLEQGPDGMTIDPSSGLILWETEPDAEGTHEVKVSIADNQGSKILVPITTVISLTE